MYAIRSYYGRVGDVHGHHRTGTGGDTGSEELARFRGEDAVGVTARRQTLSRGKVAVDSYNFV